jgi:hypothetical protein
MIADSIASVAVVCFVYSVRLNQSCLDLASFSHFHALLHLGREREALRLGHIRNPCGILLNQQESRRERSSINLDHDFAFLVKIWPLIALSL